MTCFYLSSSSWALLASSCSWFQHACHWNVLSQAQQSNQQETKLASYDVLQCILTQNRAEAQRHTQNSWKANWNYFIFVVCLSVSHAFLAIYCTLQRAPWDPNLLYARRLKNELETFFLQNTCLAPLREKEYELDFFFWMLLRNCKRPSLDDSHTCRSKACRGTKACHSTGKSPLSVQEIQVLILRWVKSHTNAHNFHYDIEESALIRPSRRHRNMKHELMYHEILSR